MHCISLTFSLILFFNLSFSLSHTLTHTWELQRLTDLSTNVILVEDQAMFVYCCGKINGEEQHTDIITDLPQTCVNTFSALLS